MVPAWIAPSILSADFARLGAEVAAVLEAGADLIHFDVMDNHYVPNLTVGPLVCEALRRHGVTAPIDVHLMVRPVDRIVPDFAAAGATFISFHPEASEHVDRTIGLIREHGCRPGLVFNPATPLDYLDYTLELLDMVLIMSVNPGFGGQQFIPASLRKLTEARARIDTAGRAVRLEVDGGIRVDNIRAASKTTMVLPVARSSPCSSRTLSTRPAISREQPTRRESSCRLTLICMPSGWVMASGSPHRSMIAWATRPVTSTKARSPSLRLVRSRRVASCVASSNTSPGLSAAIWRKRG